MFLAAGRPELTQGFTFLGLQTSLLGDQSGALQQFFHAFDLSAFDSA